MLSRYADSDRRSNASRKGRIEENMFKGGFEEEETRA